MSTPAEVAIPRSPKKGSKKMTKELGVLVMLIAAEAAVSSVTTSDGLEAAKKSSPTTSGTPPFVVDGTNTPSDFSRSGDRRSGDTANDDAYIEDEDGSAVASDSERSEHPHAASEARSNGLEDCVVSQAAEFLPWKDNLRLRGVSKQWRAAIQQSALSLRVDTATGAVFLRCPIRLNSNAHSNDLEARLKLGGRDGHLATQWRCEACHFCNSETRVICGNRCCQRPAPSHSNTSRLFFGQLWRERTVGFVQWLIEDVICDGEEALVSVENHRQPKTNRGKGCSWVYLKSKEQSDKCLTYNHRIFADQQEEGYGVWVLPPHLPTEKWNVQAAAYAEGRPLFLPRNPLVVERPAAIAPHPTAAEVSAPPVETVKLAQPRRQQQQQQVPRPMAAATTSQTLIRAFRHDPYAPAAAAVPQQPETAGPVWNSGSPYSSDGGYASSSYGGASYSSGGCACPDCVGGAASYAWVPPPPPYEAGGWY